MSHLTKHFLIFSKCLYGYLFYYVEKNIVIFINVETVFDNFNFIIIQIFQVFVQLLISNEIV